MTKSYQDLLDTLSEEYETSVEYELECEAEQADIQAELDKMFN